MRTRIMIAAAITVMELLGGCSSPQMDATAPPPPQNFRQLAISYVRNTFFDPYTVRDAEIAPPKRAMGPSLNADGFTTAWIVCIRANAKNGFGAYAGKQTTAIAMSSNAVINAWDSNHNADGVCSGVSYEPFPEVIEGIGGKSR